MQPAKRIYPGGEPAQFQSSDKAPKRAGKVNFRRHVPKSRDQSKAEDHVRTKENIEGLGQDETEEVEGRLYWWSSNICHLEDTKVKVEDLFDRDIDSQLAQDIQELLSKLIKSAAGKLNAYSWSKRLEGLVTEEFTLLGPLGEWRVCRKTYHDIDVREKSNRQYTESAIAKRIMEEAEAKAGPPPSNAQVKHVACRILAQNDGKLPKGAKHEKWPTLVRQAHEELYIHRDDAAFQSELADEIEQAIQRPADRKITQELIDLVEDKLPTKDRNAFYQFILDGEASKVCEHIKDFDIVILRDRNNELICVMVTQAVQKLFPAGTADKMSTAAEAFAWRFPYKRPDYLRHPTNQAVHLAANPNKDVHSKECEQPHFAVCGVEHYGLHHELGSSSGFERLCFQRFSSAINPRILNNIAWKEEFPKLKGGVYGVAEKVSRLSLEPWDPLLYDQYLEVREYLPEPLKMTLATTGENPYGYMAQLSDPLTEGHTDSTDWAQGMAALTCFGDFTEGDLVLKDLGVRIAFPSGSNCHLRGQGLHHLITGYKGTRHSIVLTNKESVRNTYVDFRDRFREEEAKVAELESKDPDDWSDDELKLYEASMEGKNAILELIWRSEKEKHEANSQGEGPEQPPTKKTKKTPTSK